MKKFECEKCHRFTARFICANGDGVYLAGLAFDCDACGYQWEGESWPNSKKEVENDE